MALPGRPHAEFSITYRGPALEAGTMPVRELAPALLALGEIVQEVHLASDPTGAAVHLEVQAFDKGSFGVDLSLVQTIVQQMASILSGEGGMALGTAVVLVQGTFSGYKWLRGRGIERREDHPDATTTITTSDGQRATFPSVVVNMYDSSTMRLHMADVVAPLHREGVEEIEVTAPGTEPQIIRKDEVASFELPPTAGSPILDQVSEMALMIRTVSFAEGNKWRLSNGTQTFIVAIDDRGFLERVQNDEEEFRKRDVLICRLRTRQWQTDTGLRTDYTVLEVLEHRRAPRSTDQRLFPANESEDAVHSSE